ncbi:MAG TPA: MobF family relaxase, partial [Acidimicrobiales bacterium]|nr:MobF family relaxase [Acidimicrobiales bacterium]
MLSPSKVQFGREGYYLDITASGRDHADGLVEDDGVWLSSGAAALGLAGVASPAGVRAVLAGADPATGEALLRLPDRRTNAAFDLTFSAPKTVSILHALGKLAGCPEVTTAVRQAHESAVRASLAYLETSAARCVVAGPHGREAVDAAGLLAVAFVHRSSRAPDPHLHTHVLVANLVVPATGGPARPLDARPLFAELKPAGALYETHLRFELTVRLGVEWDFKDRVWADLKGLPDELVAKYSRRSTEIRLEAERQGATGRRAIQLIADQTRPPKDTSVTQEEIEAAWDVVRLQTGLSNGRLLSVIKRVDGAEQLALESAGWQERLLDAVGWRTPAGSFAKR